MKAVIYNGSYVVGFHEFPNAEEFDALGTEYDLMEELPEIIITPPPQGYIVKRLGFNDYTLELVPPAPKSEIELLREENADLKSRIADIELAFADIISGGGI